MMSGTSIKKIIEVKKKVQKRKFSNFLSTLFGNKNFISQESPIFADFKKWIP